MNFTATVFTFTENLHAACVIVSSRLVLSCMMYYFAWNPLHWVLLPVDQIHCFPYVLSVIAVRAAVCLVASGDYWQFLALLAQDAMLGISSLLRHPQCGTSPRSQLPRPSSLQQPCGLRPRGVWGRGPAEHLVVSVGWSQPNVQVRCTCIGLAEHWMPRT